MKRLLVSLMLLLVIFCSSCKNENRNTKLTYPYTIFTSIIPHKYIIERVAGNKGKVIAMVRPGFSPATYEPLPKQITKLSGARIYFKTGVPFERAWLGKITSFNGNMNVVDLAKGIKLLSMKPLVNIINEQRNTAHNEHNGHGHHSHHTNNKDPHIWLSPKLVINQVNTITKALIKLDKRNKEYYQNNERQLIKELNELSVYINGKLKNIKTRKLMVFHPTFGYFAKEFNLKQIPIEVMGKEPTARQLTKIIEYAKKNNVKIIFVQKQFSDVEANAIASSIGGTVVQINPLAYDYINNLKSIADKISNALGK